MVTFSQQTSSQPSSTPAAKGGAGKWLPVGLILLVAVGVIAGGYWFLRGRSGGIVSGEYQAIFLSNGQVYFGKVADADSSEIVLKDIYYLITRPQLQTQTPEATPGAQQQMGYTLIKLGQELHGPMDEMRINRRHVLFVEGLKKDGRVVQAIEQFKAKQQEQPQE